MPTYLCKESKLTNKQRRSIMNAKKITEFFIEGKTPISEDGIDNYSYDLEEINDLAQELVDLFSLHGVI
jgi:hypothetical protein